LYVKCSDKALSPKEKTPTSFLTHEFLAKTTATKHCAQRTECINTRHAKLWIPHVFCFKWYESA
ncbi:MAG: hypothetical protein ABJL35_03600, partial [Parasphingorhabdus sp.]|uniref:hypothetical protein n=1 Tax=Parasphingorhabdus sp. TaxID=2709688 RepID=UPI00329944FA